MSDELEIVDEPSFVGGLTRENARALLDAAVELGYPRDVVATTEDGFLVPADVADKAFPAAEAEDDEPETVESLKAQIKELNEANADNEDWVHIPVSGNKDELRARLDSVKE